MGVSFSSTEPPAPLEYCLVPPVIRPARRRSIIPIDYDDRKVGVAATELMRNDFTDQFRVQLSVHPESDVEFATDFALSSNTQISGLSSLRYDTGNLSVQGELNTNTAGQVQLTALYNFPENRGIFTTYKRELGILEENQSNVLQVGLLQNSNRVAWSLKTGVNLDQIQKGKVDEFHGELCGVLNINERVSTQVNAKATSNLSTPNKVKVEDLRFTAAYHSPGTVSEAQPKFETALSVSEFGKKLNFSYYQHIVNRRKVYNPFAETNVKQIVNYLDLGLEVELRNIKGKLKNNLHLGMSWQMTKNVVVKGKMGSSGLFGVFKFKTWGVPKFCGALTAGVKWNSQPFFGLSISIEDIRLQNVYEQPPSDLQVTTPYGQIGAQLTPQVSDKVYVAMQK